MPAESEIAKLILKYLREELATDEKNELSQWLEQSESHRAFLEKMQDPEWIQSRLNILSKMDEKRIWRSISGSIKAKSGFAQLTHASKRLLTSSIYPSAAAVLGIIATIFFLPYHHIPKPRDSKGEDIGQAIHSDEPNKEMARLTIENNARIILDRDVRNGDLGDLGASEVSKVENSEILYSDPEIKKTLKGISYNILTTPKASQFHFKLPDGTMVWLNNASSIRYPTTFWGGSIRTLELIEGEAYFDVSRDKRSPFVVRSKNVFVSVLGTCFNLKAYSDEPNVEASLISGSIKVACSDTPIVLKPGERVTVDTMTKTMKVDSANPRSVLAWQHGLFSFHNADIKSVLHQLARWYGIDVIYKGNLPDKRFDGDIDRNLELSQILKILKSNQVNFILDGKTLTVSQ